MVAVLGVGVDQFGGVKVASAAVLTLVTLGSRVVAVGAFALDIAVGEKLAVDLVIELLGGLLDQFAIVIKFAEELGGKPNIDELANDLGISQEEVLKILKLTGTTPDDESFQAPTQE